MRVSMGVPSWGGARIQLWQRATVAIRARRTFCLPRNDRSHWPLPIKHRTFSPCCVEWGHDADHHPQRRRRQDLGSAHAAARHGDSGSSTRKASTPVGVDRIIAERGDPRDASTGTATGRRTSSWPTRLQADQDDARADLRPWRTPDRRSTRCAIARATPPCGIRSEGFRSARLSQRGVRVPGSGPSGLQAALRHRQCPLDDRHGPAGAHR